MAFDRGHALVIGVRSHKFSPQYDLPIAFQDAQVVRNILVDPAACGYPEQQIDFLHDEAATTRGIIAALDHLAKRVTESDTVFIFFAGHGAFGDDGNYYLATHDVMFVSSGQRELAVEAGTGLSQTILVEKLKQIKARRLLMIFNSCHAGSLQPQTLGEKDPLEGWSLPAVTASALLSTGEGRIVISACKPDQLSSFLRSDELTFFTGALQEGLTGKSIPSDGFISAFNLYTYVYDAVTTRVKPFGVAQDPMITVLQGVGPFPVALAPTAKQTLSTLAPEELPESDAVYRVSRGESEHWLAKIEQQTIVQGDYVQGDYVQGDKVAGDKIEQQINTGGGDFTTGDKITIGTVSGRSNVVVGRGSSMNVSEVHYSSPRTTNDDHLLISLLTSSAFSLNDLKGITALVGLEWDDLDGDGQQIKAVSLVQAVKNEGKMADLKEKIALLKPDLKESLT